MRSFTQFLADLAEVAMPSNKLPYTGKAHAAGAFEFPDMRLPYQPGQRPMAGWQSLQHYAQGSMERESFYTLTALELMGSIANNIYSTVQSRQTGQQVQGSELYPNSNYHNSGLLYGLTRQEIEGMAGYKRLNPQQFALCQEMGIIVKDTITNNPEMLAININVLKQRMQEYQQKMKGHHSKIHLAGMADNLLSTMGSGGNVPLMRNIS
jgi:hypothetical protein